MPFCLAYPVAAMLNSKEQAWQRRMSLVSQRCSHNRTPRCGDVRFGSDCFRIATRFRSPRMMSGVVSFKFSFPACAAGSAGGTMTNQNKRTKGRGDGDIIAVTVRLDRAAADRVNEIVRELKSAGLTDLDLHERLMMVSGNVDSEAVDALRAVPGVASVRADQKYSAS